MMAEKEVNGVWLRGRITFFTKLCPLPFLPHGIFYLFIYLCFTKEMIGVCRLQQCKSFYFPLVISFFFVFTHRNHWLCSHRLDAKARNLPLYRFHHHWILVD
ncbi:hypothetical protein, unlikely [Trypanosoma brucei gambiense DAL972]|uniref:Uncharacterized protein n=1 Tax=Trypanosoma brucei gambiense (strain MHOM/CI/86/DAL972) TaxID=679716 RepID=C9ZZ24_TRYB9|nr:hypothetical protein, unlikely [Trypanosoma brucei gambiense DAL972]CBH14673.1 hypothetical protein, unlikely [Trypanosoma brucei gambiense DAL972]|eukprot:XP_011776939.1 hypothetical protein, unlikely [Trypanosoma brucei gambiense DAL972]